MQVWRASERQMPDMTEPAATVVHVEIDRYVVACGGGAIELEEISYGEQTYEGRQLSRLLGGGGQILGGSPNCLRNLKPF
jgi:hypothetical protein